MRRALGLVGVYVAAAVVLTWPLAVHLTDRLGALQDVGDPFLNLWILGWGMQTWLDDPAAIFSGRVFNANIFHPAEGTLAYSDHFLLQAFALAPLYAITRDAVLCYNVLLLVSLTASGLAMHALVRGVTGSTPAAFAAGLAWAMWPYRTAHLLHLQLQALYFMPLALLWLHKVAAGRRWRDALGLGVFTALQAIASVYYGVMTAIVLVLGALSLGIWTGQWRKTRYWSRLAIAAAVALVCTVPVLLPYLRSQQSEGFGRTVFEAGNHSATLQSYTQVPPSNLLYGQTGLLDPRAPRPGARDRRSVEHQIFPGAMLLLLAALGLWRHGTSDAKAVTRTAALIAAAGLVLSFGPEGFRALYATLHDGVFGFQAIRAPARFTVVAVLGLALLAGLGVRSLAGGGSRPIWLAAVFSVLLLEYANAPLPLASAPDRSTDVGQWLKGEPAPGAVLHLPLTIDLENTPFMVQSLEHRRPIVNGYSGQRPPFYSSIVDGLADLPSPAAFATLRELDVRFVVAPEVVAGSGAASSPLVERARLSRHVIYEVRWTPEAERALADVATPSPPAPGPAPFRAGERATYDVYWDGGPLNVAAGQAQLEVIDGEQGGERWEFEVRASTANWVSSFFQARDRFTTRADASLRPIEHVREIREGRRQLDRTYVFDHEARLVRVGGDRAAAMDPTAMTLPLGTGAARDAVSALYYVRTLPLAPGSTIAVPINEAGTSLVMNVAVGEMETIEHRGRQVRALRLEPRLMRRIERRRPLTITMWLSDDDGRVPLRVLVDAGFGRVRLELVDYRRD